LVFDETENADWEQFTLTLFLFYELSLGQRSYWFPYLIQMPTVQFTCHWSQEDILLMQDFEIEDELEEYAVEIKA
jgi:hypothetical protein